MHSCFILACTFVPERELAWPVEKVVIVLYLGECGVYWSCYSSLTVYYHIILTLATDKLKELITRALTGSLRFLKVNIEDGEL